VVWPAYRQLATATQAIRRAITQSGTTLTQIHGVGPVLAAKILGHTGDVGRFPNRDHYASYTGAAPIEASSGKLRRHRLNRTGNRQLNCALHIIAVCQIRDPDPGQAYYRRKLAQAKPHKRPPQLQTPPVQRRLPASDSRPAPPNTPRLTHRGADLATNSFSRWKTSCLGPSSERCNWCG
jgi:Transposase IS116/IS110/IS902 family